MTENNSSEQTVKHHCAIERNLCQNCNCLPGLKAQRLNLSNPLAYSCSYQETKCDRNKSDTLLQVANYCNLVGVMLESVFYFRIHRFATIYNSCFCSFWLLLLKIGKYLWDHQSVFSIY